MGSVYLARHPRLPMNVALKILLPELGRDDEARAYFHREADIVARLQHPHIVRVHDRGAEGDHLWIAMDYVNGPDIAQLLRSGPLPPQRTLEIIGQAAQGLDHAHRQGVLHRDVKPANLLTTMGAGRNHVYLTDFGIARTADDPTTVTASVRATFAYAAPELLTGGVLDHRADIYALGATLYRLLTNTVPYPRDTLAAILHAHLTQPPPQPTAVRSDLPPRIDQVIAIAMAKDPADRYPTCLALAHAAHSALQQFGPGSGQQWAPPTRPIEPGPQPDTQSSRDARPPSHPSWPQQRVPPIPQPNPAPTQLNPAVHQPRVAPTQMNPAVHQQYPARPHTNPSQPQPRLPQPYSSRPQPYPILSDPNTQPPPADTSAPPKPRMLSRRRFLIGAAIAVPVAAAAGSIPLLAGRDGSSGPQGARLRAVLSGHTGLVHAVAFSPDGKTLATASFDNTARLWNVEAQAQQGEPLTGHSDRVRSVAFSPDGTLLATTSADTTARIWEVSTGYQSGDTLTEGSVSINGIAFSPDGTLLAIAASDSTVHFRSAKTRTASGNSLTGHNGAVAAVAFSPDGTTVATASFDTTLRLWDLRTRQSISDPLTGHTDRVRTIAFNSDGTLLATNSADATARLWDVRTRKQLGEPITGHTAGIRSVAFSPDGRTLVTTSDDRTARLWDIESRAQIGEPLTGHTDAVYAAAFSPDGSLLATTSSDKTIRLWTVSR
ncbi:protein kinase [Nocardia huaxiensis]|uniref:Protein kinase n=2 Tax=Nocardia huaxiensis TaxID=2755382 RepID=A0A7D6ZGX4_9NOCA|nr:protein kinase [Nocardia huaxiensis]